MPPWVERVAEHCRTTYRRGDGLLVISVDAQGKIRRRVPVIADFGDVLPFLEYFGYRELVDDQLRRAEPHLWNALYRRDGKVRLFLNHDWLLGLLDLYRQRRDPALLIKARAASEVLKRRFRRRGFLIDELPERGGWRARLWPASPFNGGFIELWAELHHYSGDLGDLAAAETLATAWTETPTFKRHGVFERVHTVRYPRLNALLRLFTRMRARLFKDNTNLVWGLLTLFEATGQARWRTALVHWLDGFERRFWNDGRVYQHLGLGFRGRDVHIKAAFAALDLLTDYARAGVEPERAERLAVRVAEAWLGLQWPNGLFPATPKANYDHLDANADLVVALVKLAALVGGPEGQRYHAAALRCRDGLLEHHAATAGYVLSVKRDGAVHDDTVLVKYQALLTKLALLPPSPDDLTDDLLTLLRDR